MLFIFIASCAFAFLAWTANAIDCSDTTDNDGCYENPECCGGEGFPGPAVYTCDPLINGDCSREGVQMLTDQGIFITVINNDPEYGCDDTSCHCSWQDCYVPEPETNGKMGE